MADTTVTSSTSFLVDTKGLWGPYWADKDTAVILYVDSLQDLRFARTTDAGDNWSLTTVQTGTIINIACWFDKETPGDIGNLIHVVWTEQVGQNFHYRTIDVSDAALGTEQTIDATVTVNSNPVNNRVAITKTVNGNLIAALSTQTEIECYRSTDGGAVWTDRADVFATATEEDWVLLYPADVDPGDACALFWDRSGNNLFLKMYDDSANTWSGGSLLDASAIDDASHINMDGAIRHSDKHLLVAFHSDADTATDDLRTFDITVDSISTPAIATKTDVFAEEGSSAQCSVFINQQNDDVYVCWLSGGAWLSSVDVVYKKSTNGMTSWQAEQAYSEATSEDFRICHAGRSVGDAGGRFQPSWYDNTLHDLFVNTPNDVEFGPVADPAEKLAVINDLLVIPNRNWSM